MKKPIIATTFAGLFVKQEPWDKAHVLWYENAARQLKDESVKKWISQPNYFDGVDEVMKRLYPSLSEEQRTKRAREMFFNSVCKYIQSNPKVVNKKVVKYFRSLKEKYRLALITTNTKSSLEKILSLTELKNLFDIIECSLPEEKDDKKVVFYRFLKKYNKPFIYIGGGRKDSYDFCKEYKIRCIFANLENSEEIPDIKSAHNLRELKKLLIKTH